MPSRNDGAKISEEKERLRGMDDQYAGDRYLKTSDNAERGRKEGGAAVGLALRKGTHERKYRRKSVSGSPEGEGYDDDTEHRKGNEETAANTYASARNSHRRDDTSSQDRSRKVSRGREETFQENLAKNGDAERRNYDGGMHRDKGHGSIRKESTSHGREERRSKYDTENRGSDHGEEKGRYGSSRHEAHTSSAYDDDRRSRKITNCHRYEDKRSVEGSKRGGSSWGEESASHEKGDRRELMPREGERHRGDSEYVSRGDSGGSKRRAEQYDDRSSEEKYGSNSKSRGTEPRGYDGEKGRNRVATSPGRNTAKESDYELRDASERASRKHPRDERPSSKEEGRRGVGVPMREGKTARSDYRGGDEDEERGRKAGASLLDSAREDDNDTVGPEREIEEDEASGDMEGKEASASRRTVGNVQRKCGAKGGLGSVPLSDAAGSRDAEKGLIQGEAISGALLIEEESGHSAALSDARHKILSGFEPAKGSASGEAGPSPKPSAPLLGSPSSAGVLGSSPSSKPLTLPPPPQPLTGSQLLPGFGHPSAIASHAEVKGAVLNPGGTILNPVEVVGPDGETMVKSGRTSKASKWGPPADQMPPPPPPSAHPPTSPSSPLAPALQPHTTAAEVPGTAQQAPAVLQQISAMMLPQMGGMSPQMMQQMAAQMQVQQHFASAAAQSGSAPPAAIVMAARKAAELVNQSMGIPGSMSADEKKKLLWGGKKEKVVEEPAAAVGINRWDTVHFSDRDREEKFQKLMGVKADMLPGGHEAGVAGPAVLSASEILRSVSPSLPRPAAADMLGAPPPPVVFTEEKQREIQDDLERQFAMGLRRRDGRTVGLGL